MANVVNHSVTVTTDGDGAATAYAGPLRGVLSHIRYVKDDFDNGSTFTITDEETGATLWTETSVNASATRAPRHATHSTAGVAATYDGTRAVLERIPVAARAKIVISSGGATKSGTFHFTTE